MRHRTWLFAIALVVMAVIAHADDMEMAAAADDPPSGHMAMMMHAPMMSMMGALEMAAWDGKVYVIKGGELMELGPDLAVMKTVKLAEMRSMMKKMQEAGMCPMTGMMMGKMEGEQAEEKEEGYDESDNSLAARMHRERERREMRGKHMGMMDGPRGREMMKWRMAHMQMMRSMSRVALAADEQGVYVLRAGTLTMYDHDLNVLRSMQLVEPKKMASAEMGEGMMKQMSEQAGEGEQTACPMCQRMMSEMSMPPGGMMQPGGCPTCAACGQKMP